MDQVKKDMEQNEKLKKDWEKFQETSGKMSDSTSRQGENVRKWAEGVKSASSRHAVTFAQWKEKTEQKMSDASQAFHKTTEENESLRNAKRLFERSAGSATQTSQNVFSKVRGVASGALDSVSQALSKLDDGEKASKLQQWKASREHLKEQREAEAAQAKAAEAAAAEGKEEGAPEGAAGQHQAQAPPVQEEYAMVVSERGNSSWDRFGAGLRDMPFL